MTSFSFTRQVLVFIAVWGLLIYIFVTKLNANGAKESDELQRLNQALSALESTKSLDNELRHLLDEYANDIGNVDAKFELLKKINSKFQASGGGDLASTNSGTPLADYEHYRRRVGNNIQELWNYLFAEAQKIEKTLKTDDPQQGLKQLTTFVQSAVEQKR